MNTTFKQDPNIVNKFANTSIKNITECIWIMCFPRQKEQRNRFCLLDIVIQGGGSGRRGLHLRPPPNPLCTSPSRFPLQVVGPLGDGLASLVWGLARPGPARSNPATRRSPTSPDPRPGSRVGPRLCRTG
ncbi:hypothetical protein XENOCAPTIV_027568 [Xenoophorus captivus]|uniref:Uncharacterized protein n=1 Tax=Xenoophorus captivus TaxID=1517983 RepID=A0ABV0QLA2_9TELE